MTETLNGDFMRSTIYLSTIFERKCLQELVRPGLNRDVAETSDWFF